MNRLPAAPGLLALGWLAVSLSGCGGSESGHYVPPAENGETEPVETPADVAYRILHAQRQQEVDTLAALMHSEAVSEFKSLLAPAVVADTAGDVVRKFFDVGSAGEYEALDDRAVFRRFVRNLYQEIPALRGVLSTLSGSVVGTVAEGDTLRHVVYRTTVGSQGLGVVETQVLTLKLDEGEWRAVLPMELRRIGRMFGDQGQVSGS